MKKIHFLIASGVVVLATSVVAAFHLSAKKDSPFSSPRLNNGISVGAPDSWRWCRDGIQVEYFKVLAGSPVEEEAKTPIEASFQTLKYDSGVIGSPHVFLFNKDGFLVSNEWYQGIKEGLDLPAPVATTENDLKVLYPRCVPMTWQGKSDLGYHVDVQIFHPGKGWNPSFNYYTKNTKAVHKHTGANEGRWRVRSINKEGAGMWSDFIIFTCKN